MTKEELDHLAALEHAASPGPWHWWTSNSWRRLGTPDRDGIILCPHVNPSDKHPDLTVSTEDMALIESLRNGAPDLLRAARERDELVGVLRDVMTHRAPTRCHNDACTALACKAVSDARALLARIEAS